MSTTTHEPQTHVFNRIEQEQICSQLREIVDALQNKMLGGKSIAQPLSALEKQIENLRRYTPRD